MKIKIHQVPEEGLHLEGQEAPSILDISEPLFRFESPVFYRLDISWVGDRSLLIRGYISTIVRAQCVRTLHWFDLPLVKQDFQHHQETIQGDEVDLTQQIREDILLLLPSNPVSPQAESLNAKQPVEPKIGNKVWEKLDRLKLKWKNIFTFAKIHFYY